MSVRNGGLKSILMGYYLTPKSYLRPKQTTKTSQKILAITTAGITLVATFVLLTSIEFGDSKSALANVNVEKQSSESIKQPATSNSIVIIPQEVPYINVNFPVELAYFKAKENPAFIELKWSSTTEYKNKSFSIEKSSNGSGFYEIGSIPGSGSSNYSPDYSFVDEHPGDGVIFYRLRQISENGRSTFVAIEKIDRNHDAKDGSLYIEQVGPAPFEKYFNIDYYSEREGGVSVELFDMNGNQVYKCYTEANQGYNTCRFIDGDNLSEEQYTLRIANSSGAFVKRIKKKI